MSVTSEARWQTLIADAASLRALALAFERPGHAADRERALDVAELSDESVRESVAATREIGEGTYLAVLGPGGVVSPREAGWRGRVDPAEILADVAAFYEAFAYRPRRTEDPPDHLAVEVGFVAYLRLKEAFALANEDDAAAKLTANACDRFLDLHLRRWAGRLAARLAELGVVEFAPAAQALCARFGACATTEDAVTSGLGTDPWGTETSGTVEGLWSCGGPGCEGACPHDNDANEPLLGEMS